MPLPRGCPPDGTAGVAGADTPLALRWLCGVAPALARHLQVKTVANKRHRGAGQGGSHLGAGVKLRLSVPVLFAFMAGRIFPSSS